MTAREYGRYSEELNANGYEYCINTPYFGRTQWRKCNLGDGLITSIEIDVYNHHMEVGDKRYELKAFAEITRTDCDCKVSTEIAFDTLNIVDIESMVQKYVERLKQ